MNRDDIIRMARECGLTINDQPMLGVEHFAQLVAAATRESMKADGWRACAVDPVLVEREPVTDHFADVSKLVDFEYDGSNPQKRGSNEPR